MDDSDPAAKVSSDLLRVLASRRVGLAAALLVAAGGLSAGWVSLGTQQRKWIFQATPVPSANADELAAVARAEGMVLSLSACRAGWGGRRGSRRYVRRSAAAAGARPGGGHRA